MPKKRYLVVVGVSYPTDPVIIQKLLGGMNLPMEERGMVEHAPGEIVDDVPVHSVNSLLEQGVIVEVPEDGEIR